MAKAQVSLTQMQAAILAEIVESELKSKTISGPFRKALQDVQAKLNKRLK